MIKYKKMSLFDAPNNSCLVHACNTQGAWGAGIAAEFKKRFPKSYIQYNTHCRVNDDIIGSFVKCDKENDNSVVNLFTSSFESKDPDKEGVILVNTTLALDAFLHDFAGPALVVYSNKFNSGLFNVPWEKTEAILKILTRRYGVTWTICDPDLDENFDGVEIK